MADTILDRLSAKNIWDLRGVVAVVTGGGSGIGLMITTALIANGANVYIIGPQNTLDSMEKVAKTYNDAAGKTEGRGKIIPLAGDVRDKQGATRLASTIFQCEPNGITVLFNNAGIARGSSQPLPSSSTTSSTGQTKLTAADFIKSYFDPVSPSDFEDSLAVNAVGPYWMTFAFLPLLEQWRKTNTDVEGGGVNQGSPVLVQGKGGSGAGPGGAGKPGDVRGLGGTGEERGRRRFVPQIIMTSSMNGWTKDPATGGMSFPYIYSKSAIGHATATLAHELLPLGIRVNGIAPGLFITEMTAPGSINELGQSSTDRRPGFEIPTTGGTGGGSARDMGSLALMLVANWFMNGETVLIDGGTMLKHPSSW